MSKKPTIHAETDHGKSMCGLRGLPASRLGVGWSRVTCSRCKKIGNVGQTWAQKRSGKVAHATRSVVPKGQRAGRARRKHSDLVQLDERVLEELRGKGTDGDFSGWLTRNAESGPMPDRLVVTHPVKVVGLTRGVLEALKRCDGDPRRSPMLRVDVKGEPTCEVPNPLYVPPGEAMTAPYGRYRLPAYFGIDYGTPDPRDVETFKRAVEQIQGSTLRGLIESLGLHMSPPDGRQALYVTKLEAVASFASELCAAIDAAEEDIGGHRGAKHIIADLGTALNYVDQFKAEEKSRRVNDENAG